MASVTITKHTVQSACAGQVRHIYRENEFYSNADISRPAAGEPDPNVYLSVGKRTGGDAVRQRIHALIADIDTRIPPKRIKADRKTVAELCIPAPREGMSRKEASDFFEATLKELQSDKTLQCHIAGGAMHADEVHEYTDPTDKQKHVSRAHMHLLVVPETEKGCNMKSWLHKGRYRQLNELLDRVCERELGYKYQDGRQSQSRGTVEVMKQKSVEAETARLMAEQETQRQLLIKAVKDREEAEEKAEAAHKKALEVAEAIEPEKLYRERDMLPSRFGRPERVRELIEPEKAIEAIEALPALKAALTEAQKASEAAKRRAEAQIYDARSEAAYKTSEARREASEAVKETEKLKKELTEVSEELGEYRKLKAVYPEKVGYMLQTARLTELEKAYKYRLPDEMGRVGCCLDGQSFVKPEHVAKLYAKEVTRLTKLGVAVKPLKELLDLGQQELKKEHSRHR